MEEEGVCGGTFSPYFEIRRDPSVLSVALRRGTLNSPTYSGSKGCPLVIPGFLPSNSASRNKAQEKISHLLDVPWATLLKAKDRFQYPLSRRIYPLDAPTGLRRNQPCLGLQTRVGEGTGSRAPQSLPEMQLSRRPRLCAQAILPAGEWG